MCKDWRKNSLFVILFLNERKFSRNLHCSSVYFSCCTIWLQLMSKSMPLARKQTGTKLSWMRLSRWLCLYSLPFPSFFNLFIMCMHICACVVMHTHRHACMHTDKHSCMCTHTNIHMSIHAHTPHTHACTQTEMYIRTNIHMHIHAHTYTHTTAHMWMVQVNSLSLLWGPGIELGHQAWQQMPWPTESSLLSLFQKQVLHTSQNNSVMMFGDIIQALAFLKGFYMVLVCSLGL